MNDQEINKVFVYGTLRTGDRRGNVLDPSLMVCEKAFVKGFTLHDLGSFPGVLEGEGQVRGEMHTIDAKTLEILDHIEGFRQDDPKSSLYIRKVVPVMDESDQVIGNAWIYIFNTSRSYTRPAPPIIESGDWFEHREFYSKTAEV